jgi:hypothetical protein
MGQVISDARLTRLQNQVQCDFRDLNPAERIEPQFPPVQIMEFNFISRQAAGPAVTPDYPRVEETALSLATFSISVTTASISSSVL